MKGKFKLNHLIVHLILLVGVIVVVFPFAWMILTSFKTSGEAMKIRRQFSRKNSLQRHIIPL